MQSSANECKRELSRKTYICILVLITAGVALAATWGVLLQTSSDSDTEVSSELIASNQNPKEINFEMNAVTMTGTANVLLILLDDAGWADFSFQTDDQWYALHTPNMDTIVTEGYYFSNYYTQSICTPARASLMTGRWTWVLGVQREIIFSTCMDAQLSNVYPTYAELSREKGYSNYLYGKWHLGMRSYRATPLGRGFDEYMGNFNSGGISGGGGSIGKKGGWYSIHPEENWGCNTTLADRFILTNTYTECLMRSWSYYYADWNSTTSECYSFLEQTIPDVCKFYNKAKEPYINTADLYKEGVYIHLPLIETSIDFWRNGVPGNPELFKRQDMAIFDEATAKIEELSHTPSDRWTMMLSLKTPHQDPTFLENGTHTEVVPFCSRFFDQKSKYYNYDRGAICQQMYEVDERIGSMINLLKELGTWDDTLVILTNDNGGTSGQNPGLTDDEAEYNYAINYPLRGVKSSYYEGGVKTILAISGGALPSALRGTENTNLHHVSDIAPTILAAGGYSDNELEDISNGTNFDGYPLLSTKTASYHTHEHIYLSMPSRTQNYWSNNTVLILANGLKLIGPGGDLSEFGYWGTLPVWETVGPKWENCTEGCVWDLTTDPYEETDIGYLVDHTPFDWLIEIAYKSDQWDDGITADMASCSFCSCCQSCTYDNTTVEEFGYHYYTPWIDDTTVL